MTIRKIRGIALAAGLVAVLAFQNLPASAQSDSDDAVAEFGLMLLDTLVEALTEQSGGTAEPATEEDVEEFILFVLGNTLHTFYHEIGHALVHQLEIPIVGREEDAVDALATILMISEEADEISDELIASAADGFAMSHDHAGDGGEMMYWGEHSFDLQRYASIMCLIYGSDPEGFAELIEVHEMPEDQQERCPYTFQQTANGWQALLKPHLNEGDSGAQVIVRYAAPRTSGLTDMKELLQSSGIFEEAGGAIAEILRLPDDLIVTFQDCGVINAFYDPGNGQVTMCYELVQFYAELIVADMQAR